MSGSPIQSKKRSRDETKSPPLKSDSSDERGTSDKRGKSTLDIFCCDGEIRRSICTFYDAQIQDQAYADLRPLDDGRLDLSTKDGWLIVPRTHLEDLYIWAFEDGKGDRETHEELLERLDELFGDDPDFTAINENELDGACELVESFACQAVRIGDGTEHLVLDALKVLELHRRKYKALLTARQSKKRD